MVWFGVPLANPDKDKDLVIRRGQVIGKFRTAQWHEVDEATSQKPKPTAPSSTVASLVGEILISLAGLHTEC